jgi:alkaline phosphatase
MIFSKVRLLALISLTFAILMSCQSFQYTQTQPKVKNVILMIGDGMGPAYLKAYRLLKDDPQTEAIEMTLFDQYLIGTIDTAPKGKRGKVTDSAAAATAYATGYKVLSRTLSITEKNEPLLTVLEKAKQRGKSTGLIATSPITGATPAAFIAHHSSRYNYAEIADQFIDNQFNNMPYVDILLGGGAKYFEREDRNLVKEFESLGFNYVTNNKALLENTDKQVVGLFAYKQLDKMMDRTEKTPSLAEMTKSAIKQLSKNDKGFFLMIEGSQIDWAGHRKDIVGAMTEMEDFELAMQEVLKFAKKNGETQLILTADHSTGGLSIGTEVDGKKYYEWNADVVNSFIISPEEIARLALISHDLYAEFKKASTMQLTQVEINKLKGFSFPLEVMEKGSAGNLNKAKNISSIGESKLENDLVAILTKIINDHSYTGWTTKGHTGVDVNLYAYGPRSKEITGHSDNTRIGQFIFELLEEN